MTTLHKPPPMPATALNKAIAAYRIQYTPSDDTLPDNAFFEDIKEAVRAVLEDYAQQRLSMAGERATVSRQQEEGFLDRRLVSILKQCDIELIHRALMRYAHYQLEHVYLVTLQYFAGFNARQICSVLKTPAEQIRSVARLAQAGFIMHLRMEGVKGLD